jgi:hypothetical protein
MLEARRRLKAEYGQLFDSIASILFRHDPVGINFGDNADEYGPETGTILPRLRTCHSADDVRRVVHEEFVRWFYASTAGSAEHYTKIASEIWELWRRSKLAPHSDGADGNCSQ